MRISDLIKMLEEAKMENGDIQICICTDGTIYEEIEINCPDRDSPLYIEGYSE